MANVAVREMLKEVGSAILMIVKLIAFVVAVYFFVSNYGEVRGVSGVALLFFKALLIQAAVILGLGIPAVLTAYGLLYLRYKK